MARIIRTQPKPRRRASLRVIFSFLLFMQIQLPNAHAIRGEKVNDLSFYISAKKAQQISLAEKETKIPAAALSSSAN